MLALKDEETSKSQFYKLAITCQQTMQRELTQLLTQKNSNNLYLYIISKYDFLNRYKILIIDDRDKHKRPKVQIKLKTKYKTAFMETIISSMTRTPEEIQTEVNLLSTMLNQSNLIIPKSVMNSEISSRSRNVHNNLYTNKTDNNINPNRALYASDRQKSIGSTIFRDHDTIEHLVKDDRKYDVIPIGNAMKPIPKNDVFRSSIYESKVEQYNIIEEEKDVSAREKGEEEVSYKVLSRNEVFQQREDSKKFKKDQLRIEGTHKDGYWCCK
jgi:hypothetical protein